MQNIFVFPEAKNQSYMKPEKGFGVKLEKVLGFRI
jgi:hypothetical protein